MKIRHKISLLGLFIPLATVTLLTAVSFFFLDSLIGQTSAANVQVGTDAAEKSERSMLDASRELLKNITGFRANFVEDRFTQVHHHLQSLKLLAENIIARDDASDAPDTAPRSRPDAVYRHICHKYPRAAAEAEDRFLDKLDRLLAVTARWVPDHIAIYAGGPHGCLHNLIIPGVESRIPADYDPASRTWYKLAEQKQGIAMRPVFIDTFTGRSIISASIPIFRPEKAPGAPREIAAVAAVDLEVEKISAEILRLPHAEGSMSFCLSQDDRVVLCGIGKWAQEIQRRHGGKEISWRPGDALSQVAEIQPLLQKIRQKDSEAFHHTFDGVNYLVSHATLPTPNWKMLVMVPEEVLLEAPREIRTQLTNKGAQVGEKINRALMRIVASYLPLALLLLLTICVLGHALSSRLVKAIENLSRGAAKIGGGDFTGKISVETHDELRSLADDFNRMAVQLDDYTRKLVNANRWEGEMNAASEIQMNMLPQVFPPFPEHREFSLFAQMTPAREIGGDFYDFFLIGEDKVCVLVGDVSGKGIPAALFMAVGKTLIKNYILENSSLNEAISKFNRVISSENTSNYFMTLFVAVLNYRTGAVEYVDAGHNPPMVSARAEADFIQLDTRKAKNPAVGMTDDFAFRSGSLELAPGGRILLYTDGVTEAENTKAVHFGEKSLALELNDNGDLANEELVEYLYERLDCFAGGQPASDDVTMLLLHYHGHSDETDMMDKKQGTNYEN